MYQTFLDELILPNKKEWIDFYNQCKETNNFNIACIGPRDSCKTTLIQSIINNHVKNHSNIDQDKIVCYFFLNDDMKFQNLNTFCQNNIHTDKFVYIEHYDDLSDTNQQTLKGFMDKFHYFKTSKHRVHFLIETTSAYKVKDFIRSRMNVFKTVQFDAKHLYDVFVSLCEKQLLCYHPSCFNFIKLKKSMDLSSLKCFMKKMKFMSIQQISFSTFHELYNHLDESVFSSYFAHLEENNPKEANQLLFELYDDGYDLSDILFFLYNYVKEHSKYNYAIEVLCDYMNEYYNGHNHQVFILFLTLDIQNKKKS